MTYMVCAPTELPLPPGERRVNRHSVSRWQGRISPPRGRPRPRPCPGARWARWPVIGRRVRGSARGAGASRRADLAASSWPQGCGAAMVSRLTQMLTQLENYRSGRFPTVSEPGSFAALASLGTAVTGSSCPSGGAQHGDRLHDQCARRGWPIGHDRPRGAAGRGDRHRSARQTGGRRVASVRQAAGRGQGPALGNRSLDRSRPRCRRPSDRSPASRSRKPARHCRL